MEALTYILNKYNIARFDMPDEPPMRMPIEIPNVGRNQLAELFAELGFTKGAEIGVEQGEYAEILLKSNPKLFLYSVDAWKAYKGYRDHTRQEKLDGFFEITKERLKPFFNRMKGYRSFSMDAVKKIDDEFLDFVYIDANHDFINVTQDIFYWSKKVRKGGIISGHDYVKRKNEAAHVHVRQVLSGYTDAYNIRPWFVLGSEAKIPGQIRDDTRSWFWVKQ